MKRPMAPSEPTRPTKPEKMIKLIDSQYVFDPERSWLWGEPEESHQVVEAHGSVKISVKELVTLAEDFARKLGVPMDLVNISSSAYGDGNGCICGGVYLRVDYLGEDPKYERKYELYQKAMAVYNEKLARYKRLLQRYEKDMKEYAAWKAGEAEKRERELFLKLKAKFEKV